MKSFSVKLLFDQLDTNGYKYITPETIFSFLSANCFGNVKQQPTLRRMLCLMRRLSINERAKISFPEFAKIIRPIQLDSYIERCDLDKYATLCEKLDAEQTDLLKKFKSNQVEGRKPLTAFSKTQLLLNRDPNRPLFKFEEPDEAPVKNPLADYSRKFL